MKINKNRAKFYILFYKLFFSKHILDISYNAQRSTSTLWKYYICLVNAELMNLVVSDFLVLQQAAINILELHCPII